MHGASRTVAFVSAMSAALALAACGGPGTPPTAVKGTRATVAWSGTLTSLNASSLTSMTAGNVDVAALTRSQFGQLDKGAFVPDPSFGTVTIVKTSPFTVRYDLAKRSWSDGAPVDAADLALAWATGADARAGFQTLPGGLAGSELARVDEFGRSIDVRFPAPVADWQAALDVAVPAHVLGRLAYARDDPMEAKQKVLDAIRGQDQSLRSTLAKAWNESLAVADDGRLDPALLASDGPYRIDKVVTGERGAQRVELVANGAYVGHELPKVERITLVSTSEVDAVEGLGTSYDVTQVLPTPENWSTFHDLERRDFNVTPSSDGTMWVLVLRADSGVFGRPAARTAFLRAAPRDELADGAGEWSSAYESSDSLLVANGGDGYQVVTEDSKFKQRLTGGDGAAELAAAGLAPGTRVCVGYDKSDAFATPAFGLLSRGMAESGWATTDCGRTGFSAGSAGKGWDAALLRVPVPTSPLELSLLWGGTPALNLSGIANPHRDDLIADLARSTDIYRARELKGAIEASIVDDAIAAPLFTNPVLTVTAPRVQGVAARPGPGAGLLSGVTAWSVR